ncbi:hypothetical protein GCM10027422_28670 [Hymenobacter arcticus]
MLAQALATYSPWQVLNNYFQDGEGANYCDDYTKRYDQVYESQLQGDPLHEAYAAIMLQFFCCQFDDITLVGYGNAVEELTETVNAYLQHPGLLTPGHIAHHRLADLYMLYSLFQALHRASLAFHAKGIYPPRKESEMPCNYDYMSERQLQYMWANLLGVR